MQFITHYCSFLFYGMQMYIRFLVLILCSLSLTACVSRPNPRWEKPGTSARVAVMDEAKCKYKIGMARISDVDRYELVENCMAMKGYQWINW